MSDWVQRAFDEHRRDLHLHCYRLAGNVTDADDLVILIALFRNKETVLADEVDLLKW